MHTFAEKARRLQRVRQALKRRHGEQPRPVVTHPVEYTLRVILSEEATPEQVDRAIERLRKGFVDWNDLRVSRLREIRDVLGPEFPRSSYKARVIPRLLDQVFKDHNSMVWDFLEGMGKVETRAYFEKLEEVRPFVAATIARDCAEAHAFPVDNDITRVLARLGIIEPGKQAETQVQAFLERAVRNTRVFETHRLLKRLAEECCTVDEAACVRCVFKKTCPSADLKKPRRAAQEAARGRAAARKAGSAKRRALPPAKGARSRNGSARKSAARAKSGKAAKRRKS